MVSLMVESRGATVAVFPASTFLRSSGANELRLCDTTTEANSALICPGSISTDPRSGKPSSRPDRS